MILAVERFQNTDNRSLEELFYGIQRDIIDSMIDCAVILIIDILPDSIRQYFGATEKQMDELVCVFIDNLPAGWKERFQRPDVA